MESYPSGEGQAASLPPVAESSSRRTSESPPPAPERRPPTNSRAKAAAEARREEQARRRRRPAVVAVAAIALLLLIAGGAYYYYSGLGVESTDDAAIAGRAISVAPQVAGQVASLDVTDNELVKEGQPIIHIDKRQYVIARDQAKAALDAAKAQENAAKIAIAIAQAGYPAQLKQAQAQLVTAQANLVNAQKNYERQIHLTRLATSQQQVDAATAAFHQAQGQVAQAQAQVAEADVVRQRIASAQAQYDQQVAQVEQAQAQLAQTELNLDRTVVRAPQSGRITNRSVNKGDYVTAGQQITSLVSPQIWVVANFKETQLTRMKPGDPVDIEVDAYPQLHLKGHVDSIQQGTGAQFSAFPPENATGNFVKVVQRVPVKIVIDSGLDPKLPLPLGLSVAPMVHLQ